MPCWRSTWSRCGRGGKVKLAFVWEKQGRRRRVEKSLRQPRKVMKVEQTMDPVKRKV